MNENDTHALKRTFSISCQLLIQYIFNYDNFRGSIYSSQHMESTALRKDGTFCFKPHCLSEGNYMVYLAFRNADDTDISNSVCVGMVRC